MSGELDLTDRMVREMADRNHTPCEQWTAAGVLFGVRCEQCGNAWPCPTREALARRAGSMDKQT